MVMTPYEDLLPYVQQHVMTAPMPMLLAAIRQTVIDYCRKSTAYRTTLVGVPAIANVPWYDLPTPSYTRPSAILIATHNKRLLSPTSLTLESQYQTRADTGTPERVLLDGTQAQVFPTPRITELGAFIFTVALQPTMSATGVDSVFMDDAYPDIVMGVLANLLLMAGQPWANPALGQQYSMGYAVAIDTAKGRANADHTAKVRVTPYNDV